ncbi:MAG: hypothetical protein CMQ43_01595 [Gammaproteobacteria bacterium]|nr:hypothetical protein [Gammaproteobacteria bacterium]MBK79599.1 hypothetical protein [Gammaproteobacteria bacterium]
MEAAILHTDEMIDYLVGYDRKNRTRNGVVRDSQAWSIAFTEEAMAYARKNGAPADTIGEYVEWLIQHYPWPVRTDPIKSWKRRLGSLRNEKDQHKALRKYQEFMTQTQPFREAIDKATAAMDQEVEMQMERMRGG